MNFYILESSAFPMIVPFVSGVSFTSGWSSESLFTSTKHKAKLNMTFYWHKPITLQNCKKTRFLSFIGTWYCYSDISLSTMASHKTSCEISFMSAYGKREQCTLVRWDTRIHTYRQFPVLMGVMEKRWSCQNSIKALKLLDFQLFLHELKGSLVLAYDTWANL